MFENNQICHRVYLRYFCKENCGLELSKIAQSGHAGPNLLLRSRQFSKFAFFAKPLIMRKPEHERLLSSYYNCLSVTLGNKDSLLPFNIKW